MRDEPHSPSHATNVLGYLCCPLPVEGTTHRRHHSSLSDPRLKPAVFFSGAWPPPSSLVTLPHHHLPTPVDPPPRSSTDQFPPRLQPSTRRRPSQVPGIRYASPPILRGRGCSLSTRPPSLPVPEGSSLVPHALHCPRPSSHATHVLGYLCCTLPIEGTTCRRSRSPSDLAHYRSTLKNKAIAGDAEKSPNGFKPVTYDVNAHIKAIETFEATAVGAIAFRIISQSFNSVGCSPSHR